MQNTINSPARDEPPTKQAYEEPQTANAHFNAELFSGTLPPCLITLQRKGKWTSGYYASNRFSNRSGKRADEIALNPSWFKNRSVSAIWSTLVHEMVHHWQFHFGTPSRFGYHNREWVGAMLLVGLYPSDSGKPGGKMVGQHVSHYVVSVGAFDATAEKLLCTKFGISWFDARAAIAMPAGLETLPNESKPAGRLSKFVCDECFAQAWGKPSLRLICSVCERHVLPVD